MAAMKLYYGSELVGGEVDLAEFEQLQTDVEGKYDKGDPSGLDGGVMQYDNAALMEAAVVGNTNEISGLQDDFEELIKALEGFDGSQLQVELSGYFKKYQDDDDDQTALIYDSAAKMGLAVNKNTQDIETNKAAITKGDTDTLQAANDYTDDAISKIPGVEGLEEFEEKVDELDKDAIRNWNSVHDIADPGTAAGGVTNVAVIAKLPDTPDVNTLYIVTG